MFHEFQIPRTVQLPRYQFFIEQIVRLVRRNVNIYCRTIRELNILKISREFPPLRFGYRELRHSIKFNFLRSRHENLTRLRVKHKSILRQIEQDVAQSFVTEFGFIESPSTNRLLVSKQIAFKSYHCAYIETLWRAYGQELPSVRKECNVEISKGIIAFLAILYRENCIFFAFYHNYFVSLYS